MTSLGAATTVLFLVALLQSQLSPATGFLFPDLKLQPDRRSADPSPGDVRYRIAVLQQEPYLFANGSGYIPDVMRQVAQSYRTQRSGEELNYELVPVATWSQLMSRARTQHGLALGLVIPSLELTGWSGRQLQSSVPVAYTTLKLVVSKRKAVAAEWTAAAATLEDIETAAVARRAHIQRTERVKMIVLRGSPVEYLLVRANGYRGPIHLAETADDAVSVLIGSTEEAVLLTDAIVADYIANKYQSVDVESVCPSRLAGSGWLHYSFFGRDEAMLSKLNEAMAPLAADDTLYTRHFGGQSPASQCPW